MSAAKNALQVIYDEVVEESGIVRVAEGVNERGQRVSVLVVDEDRLATVPNSGTAGGFHKWINFRRTLTDYGFVVFKHKKAWLCHRDVLDFSSARGLRLIFSTGPRYRDSGRIDKEVKTGLKMREGSELAFIDPALMVDVHGPGVSGADAGGGGLAAEGARQSSSDSMLPSTGSGHLFRNPHAGGSIHTLQSSSQHASSSSLHASISSSPATTARHQNPGISTPPPAARSSSMPSHNGSSVGANVGNNGDGGGGGRRRGGNHGNPNGDGDDDGDGDGDGDDDGDGDGDADGSAAVAGSTTSSSNANRGVSGSVSTMPPPRESIRPTQSKMSISENASGMGSEGSSPSGSPNGSASQASQASSSGGSRIGSGKSGGSEPMCVTLGLESSGAASAHSGSGSAIDSLGSVKAPSTSNSSGGGSRPGYSAIAASASAASAAAAAAMGAMLPIGPGGNPPSNGEVCFSQMLSSELASHGVYHDHLHQRTDSTGMLGHMSMQSQFRVDGGGVDNVGVVYVDSPIPPPAHDHPHNHHHITLSSPGPPNTAAISQVDGTIANRDGAQQGNSGGNGSIDDGTSTRTSTNNGNNNEHAEFIGDGDRDDDGDCDDDDGHGDDGKTNT